MHRHPPKQSLWDISSHRPIYHLSLILTPSLFIANGVIPKTVRILFVFHSVIQRFLLTIFYSFLGCHIQNLRLAKSHLPYQLCFATYTTSSAPSFSNSSLQKRSAFVLFLMSVKWFFVTILHCTVLSSLKKCSQWTYHFHRLICDFCCSHYWLATFNWSIKKSENFCLFDYFCSD